MSAREALEARRTATESIVGVAELERMDSMSMLAQGAQAWALIAIAAELAELRKTLEAMAGR